MISFSTITSWNKIGDFIMISRGKSKICPLGKVEFGIVEEILDDGRSLKVKVARANTKNELVRELMQTVEIVT